MGAWNGMSCHWNWNCILLTTFLHAHNPWFKGQPYLKAANQIFCLAHYKRWLQKNIAWRLIHTSWNVHETSIILSILIKFPPTNYRKCSVFSRVLSCNVRSTYGILFYYITVYQTKVRYTSRNTNETASTSTNTWSVYHT